MKSLLLLSAVTLSSPARSLAQCTEEWSRDYSHTLVGARAMLADPAGTPGSVYFAGGSFSSDTFTAMGRSLVSRAVLRFDGRTIVDVGDVPLDGRASALCAWNGGVVALLADRVAWFDGVSWSFLGGEFALAPGVPGTPELNAAAVFDSGAGPELYVGGFFQDVGGVQTRQVARWNGSTWSQAGAGLDSFVHALHVHDDGSGPALYAGGRFTSSGAVTTGRVARFDGSSWTAVGVAPNGPVVELASWNDGATNDLIAGGRFNLAGGRPATGIARWNGTVWSPLGGGVLFTALLHGVRAITTEGSGAGSRLIVGGAFNTAGGMPANNVAAFDGSTWSDLGQGLGDPPPVDASYVADLAQVDFGGGEVLTAIGNFNYVPGLNFDHGFMRLGSNGWEVPIQGLGLSSVVLDGTSWDDGSGNGEQLYVVGGLYFAGKDTRLQRIARRGASGWEPLGTGLSENVARAIVAFDGAFANSLSGDDSGLYVIGDFHTAGGMPVNGCARWDGSAWHGVGGGLGSVTSNPRRDLAVYDGGSGPRLYAVGHSENIPNGGFHAGFAVYDGTGWGQVDTSGFAGFAAYALAVFDDGSGPRLYVGGSFTQTAGGPSAPLARWNGSGFDLIYEADPDARSWVNEMVVHDDGSGEKLWLTGQVFTGNVGVLATRLASWDGLTFASIPTPLDSAVSPLTNWTSRIAVLDRRDGAAELWVSGRMTTATDSGGLWRLGDATALSLQRHPEALFAARSSRGVGVSLYAGGDFRRIEDFQSFALAERVFSCDTANSFCFGDGGVSAGCTSCPCSNDAASGSGGGCLNSSGAGSQLVAAGAPSISADSLRIEARHLPPSTSGTLFSGSLRLPSNPLNACFGLDSGVANAGDGLRCMGGIVQRHGARPSDANGSVGLTTNGWGPPSGPVGGLAAQGGFAIGQTRHFQVLHRDDVNANCGNAVNSTQGLSVVFTN